MFFKLFSINHKLFLISYYNIKCCIFIFSLLLLLLLLSNKKHCSWFYVWVYKYVYVCLYFSYLISKIFICLEKKSRKKIYKEVLKLKNGFIKKKNLSFVIIFILFSFYKHKFNNYFLCCCCCCCGFKNGIFPLIFLKKHAKMSIYWDLKKKLFLIYFFSHFFLCAFCFFFLCIYFFSFH